ncbi:MAG: GNAT family N-acetyltransferase [Kiritimatiellae bacterium]|nr:GNAT family N-acetyltransferase [Kiritimatiellia bacterium]
MPPLAFRRARGAKDRETIRRLAEATWPKTFEGILADGQIRYMLSWMYSDEAIEADENAGARWDFALDETGEPVGFVEYDGEPKGEERALELHKVYLVPEMWGAGHGQEALARVLSHAREKGAKSVWLRVNRQNVRAQKAYQRAGFGIAAEDAKDIGHGFVMDDYIFSVAL